MLAFMVENAFAYEYYGCVQKTSTGMWRKIDAILEALQNT